nr:protein shisa-4 [Odocoileus virginianus texanus]
MGPGSPRGLPSVLGGPRLAQVRAGHSEGEGALREPAQLTGSKTSCWTLGRGGPASGVAPAPERLEVASGAGLLRAGTPTGEAASGPSRAQRPACAGWAAGAARVALLVLGAPLALAGEDCLWYLDRNGSWHPGFNCEFFTFCCGTCYQRYCCRDLSLLITERQQKHCLAFSPKTIAGIASAVILFVAVVATTICCFLCSCCYLYRRRQQLQSPFEGQEIPMTGVPVQPVYPYPQDPKAGPAPPQPGFMYPPSGPAPQYPLYPAGPPVYNPAAPPPYMPPQPSYPGA